MKKAIDVIDEYITKNGISVVEFEKKVGLGNGYVRNMRNKRGNVGSGKILQIRQAFPDIHFEEIYEYNQDSNLG